ncbi:MAG: serine O-acetyltransferase [Acidobacteriota bacterium]|nr:serine O-acetyltransferase [Acidobacteriota bacterium]
MAATGDWGRLRRDFHRLRTIKGWSPLRALLDVLCFDAGFQALLLHRLAHAAVSRRIPALPALCRRLSVAFCGVDILPRAEIGGGCLIPHGLGIVIGGTAVLGEDCTLLQGVTLGEARFDELACPKVGDRVTLGARATLLGGIAVGDDAMVAAGAVVLEDVPAGATVAGVPAKELSTRRAS